MGNDVAIGMAGAGGAFELNAYNLVIAHKVLQSIPLLADGMRSFDLYCALGVELDEPHIPGWCSDRSQW